MRSYNDWIINGDWHECECGRSWSDSDGGPCCSRCVKCGELFDNEEFDEDGNCKKCFLNNFSEGCVMTDLLTEEAAKLLNDVRLLVQSEDILSVSVRINTEAEYSGSMILIKSLKDKKKEVEDSHEIVVGPLYKTYKEALAEYSPVEASLKSVIESIEKAGRTFRREADERAALLQLKFDEETRKAREKLIEAAETSEAKAAVMREEAEKLARKESPMKLTSWTALPMHSAKKQKSRLNGLRRLLRRWSPRLYQRTCAGRSILGCTGRPGCPIRKNSLCILFQPDSTTLSLQICRRLTAWPLQPKARLQFPVSSSIRSNQCQPIQSGNTRVENLGTNVGVL